MGETRGMTRAELMHAVDGEIADTLLHASYSLGPTQLRAVSDAMMILRAGLRRLAQDQGLLPPAAPPSRGTAEPRCPECYSAKVDGYDYCPSCGHGVTPLVRSVAPHPETPGAQP